MRSRACWRAVLLACALLAGALTGCAPVPGAPRAAPPSPGAGVSPVPVVRVPVAGAGRMVDVAFDRRGDRAYVAGSAGLAVLDTGSRTVVATIPVAGAQAVAVAPDGARAYVATSDGVAVVDTVADALVTVLALRAGQAGDLAVAPDGTRLYTVGGPAGAVAVLDAWTGTVLATLHVGVEPAPGRIALTSDGRTLRVAAAAGIVEIDTTTGVAGAAVPVGGAIRDLAISPDGTRTYVSVRSSGVVVVADGAGAGEIPVPGHPAGALAVDADGGVLFVGGHGPAGTRSSALDTATGAVRVTVELGLPVADAAYVPGADVVYALHPEQGVSVVDLTGSG